MSMTLKEKQLDSILVKMSSGKLISTKEKKFLNIYNGLSESKFREFELVDRTQLVNILIDLLELKFEIICLLDGNYDQVVKITWRPEPSIELEDNRVYKLKDNHLYNLKYDFKKLIYYLSSHDEYYEPIPIDTD